MRTKLVIALVCWGCLAAAAPQARAQGGDAKPESATDFLDVPELPPTEGASAATETPASVKAPAAAPFGNNVPFRNDAASGSGEKEPATPAPRSDFDTSSMVVRLLIGLGVLVAAFAALIWFLRRNPKVNRYFGGGPIKVLARSYIAPRCGVFLVKIGSRIVVVGQSTEGLTTLSEITDPAEVTRLAAAAEEANPDSMTRTFRDALKSASTILSPRKGADGRATRQEREMDNAPEKTGAAGEGEIPVDPGYGSQVKLQALRQQLDRNKAKLQ